MRWEAHPVTLAGGGVIPWKTQGYLKHPIRRTHPSDNSINGDGTMGQPHLASHQPSCLSWAAAGDCGYCCVDLFCVRWLDVSGLSSSHIFLVTRVWRFRFDLKLSWILFYVIFFSNSCKTYQFYKWLGDGAVLGVKGHYWQSQLALTPVQEMDVHQETKITFLD